MDADSLFANLFSIPDDEQLRFALMLLGSFDQADKEEIKEAAAALQAADVSPDDKAGFYRVWSDEPQPAASPASPLAEVPPEDLFNFNLFADEAPSGPPAKLCGCK